MLMLFLFFFLSWYNAKNLCKRSEDAMSEENKSMLQLKKSAWGQLDEHPQSLVS